MSRLLIKYWKGWIDPENMNEPNWLHVWKQEAQKANDEGMELVVFKLPKKSPLISEIEKLLQERLKEKGGEE